MIKIGLIGAGAWGKNYIPVLRSIKGVQLKWIYKKSKPTDFRPPKDTELTQSFFDILNDPKVNAVIIATPLKTHHAIAKAALLKGKDVLVEKPFTYTTKQARELIKIAKQKERVLMIGHIFLYHPLIIKMKEMINEDYFGKINNISLKRTSMYDSKNSLWELGSHDLYILEHFLKSEPIEIENEGPDHHQHTKLTYKNNVTASLETCTDCPEKVRLIIIDGEDKTCTFDDNKKTLVIVDKQDDTEECIMEIDGRTPLENQCSHFIKCIIDRTPPLSDGNTGLKNIKILERY